MKKKYYRYCPRGFSNEVTFLFAETEEEEERAFASDYEPITYKELTKEMRWINGENASMGSGRAIGHMTVEDIVPINRYERMGY